MKIFTTLIENGKEIAFNAKNSPPVNGIPL